MMKIGNIAPRAGFEPTLLEFQLVWWCVGAYVSVWGVRTVV